MSVEDLRDRIELLESRLEELADATWASAAQEEREVRAELEALREFVDGDVVVH
jgi:hypothetical protein